jgi:hypothetical protein
MRRIPLIQPARDWQQWWYDTGFAALLVAVVWGFTGVVYGILVAVGVGVQAGAAIRMRPRSGNRSGDRSGDGPEAGGDG